MCEDSQYSYSEETFESYSILYVIWIVSIIDTIIGSV
jgi:hypothetical protein